MKALMLKSDKTLEFVDVETPLPGKGEVLIKVQAASLNHREIWISKGLYPGLKLPAILGGDGAGTVVDVGEGVASDWLAKDVVCYPAKGWGEDEAAPTREFRLFGMPEPGFIAQYISMPVENLRVKPSHLTWEEAAALPIASLTAWRALTRHGQIKKGKKLLITGIGGGVAQAGLNLAVAMGADVFVTSSEQSKIDHAISMGAKGGAIYKTTDWEKSIRELSQGIDMVLDGAPPSDLHAYTRFLNTGAKVVIYGSTATLGAKIGYADLFLRHLQIIGTTMGSPTDFDSLLAFVTQNMLKPNIALSFPFDRSLEALAALAEGKHAGKIVINQFPA